MSNKQSPYSRSGRYEKKRRGTKMLTWLVGAGSVFMVLLVGLMVFGGEDQKGQAQDTASQEVTKEEEGPKEDSQAEAGETSDKNDKEEIDKQEEDTEEKSDKQQVSIEEFEELKPIEDEKGLKIEKSDDPNVERVITKDWPVIPTEMETNGEHRITYQSGSQDYKELQEAIRSAVGLSEDNIIYWDVSNRGHHQKAKATVSDKNKTGYLRVQIDWIEGQGYKPVKLEILKNKNG
ncbi:YrrS family protein [Halobacillus faecis]